MLGQFIESSVGFQNGTIFLMYGIIFAVLFGFAALMYVSANKNSKK